MERYAIGNTEFSKQIAIWKLQRCRLEEPQGKRLDIVLEYKDLSGHNENLHFIREFHIVDNDEVARRVVEGQAIDLSFCYVHNFNAEEIRWKCLERDPDFKAEIFLLPEFCAEFAFFDGETNFEGAVLGARNNDEISFANAIFSGGDASFFQCRFDCERVSFTEAEFMKGDVSFAEADFGNRDCIFDYAIFGAGNTSFSQTSFGAGTISCGAAFFERGDVFFTRSHFGCGEISFDYAVFREGRTIFDDALFLAKTVSFDHTDWGRGESFFNGTDFGEGKVIFREVEFGTGNFSLKQARAQEVLFVQCRFVNHDVMEFENVKHLKIHHCILDKTLSISGMETISFLDTVNLGYIYLNWEECHVAGAIADNSDSAAEKARQCSLLKENYHRLGEYEAEDVAFVEHMRWRRKGKRFFHRRLDAFIDVIGGYGTRPGKVAVSMFYVWLVYGVLFSVLGGMQGMLSSGLLEHWINGFYFSSITFFTIGYGDIVPLGTAAKVIAPVEGMMGMFLMSYFTVALVRKTLR